MRSAPKNSDGRRYATHANSATTNPGRAEKSRNHLLRVDEAGYRRESHAKGTSSARSGTGVVVHRAWRRRRELQEIEPRGAL